MEFCLDSAVLTIDCDVVVRTVGCIGLSAVVFVFTFGIACVFFEKLMIGAIHGVESVGESERIDFFRAIRTIV
ncbi:MAG: hypothetical protein IJU76_04670 [Desulfovibrionaceae bacterium]|nr:hypothetical protein [Desulfovibrionaceae bacterium]